MSYPRHGNPHGGHRGNQHGSHHGNQNHGGHRGNQHGSTYGRGYSMPMPQHPSQATPYPSSYGQQPQGQPPYPTTGQPRTSTYPAQYQTNSGPSQYTNAAPYPTGGPQSSLNSTQQPPYPTSQVQNMSVVNTAPYPTTGSQQILNNSNSYPTNASTANTSQYNAEIDGWMESAIKNLTALYKDASQLELNELVNNENKLIEIVQSSGEVKKIQLKREEIIQLNKDQAVTNLSMEPELGVLKSNLIQLALEQNDLKEKHSLLHQKVAGKVSLDSILAILQAETAKAETESDKISQDFIDNGSGENIDDFIDAFISKRISYQMRKVKSEKMTQLMNGGIITTNTNATKRSMPVPRPRPNQGGYGGYGGY